MWKMSREFILSRGDQHIIHQRLRNHLRRSIAAAEEDCPPDAVHSINPLNLDYLVVIDFEATCQHDCPKDWVYEIIEFPAILLNVHTLETVRCLHWV